MWNLFARSAWAQPATAEAGTTGEGPAMDSVFLFGVISASHCGGITTSEGDGLAAVLLVGVGQPATELAVTIGEGAF